LKKIVKYESGSRTIAARMTNHLKRDK